MPTSRLDHERSRHAVERILEKRFPDAVSVSHRDEVAKRFDLESYRSLVVGAGPMLRQCGILQWSAFLLSKDPVKSAQHRAVLVDVVEWLRKSPLTAGVAREKTGASPREAVPPQGGAKILGAFLARDSHEIAILETEAELILQWLKRVTEGLYKGLESSQQDGE